MVGGPAEEEATEYLLFLDHAFCQAGNREMSARWDYITDITEGHEEAMVGLNEGDFMNTIDDE